MTDSPLSGSAEGEEQLAKPLESAKHAKSESLIELI